MSKIVTVCLWTITLFSFVASWAVWFLHDERMAVMLATTAVIPLAAAVLSQIRCYTLRVCEVMRVTSGVASAASLHRLR